jgi:hypothetical protein
MAQTVNPADFKNCISVCTISGKIMYALTNDDNITYGDILTNILHQVTYRVVVGDYYHKTEHLFLKDRKTKQTHYDLTETISLEKNSAHLYMTFEPCVYNYNPSSWKHQHATMISMQKKLNEQLAEYKDKQKQNPEQYTHVFIKTLTGKTIKIDVNLMGSVEDLKQLVQQKEGTPTTQQRLIYVGKQLEDIQPIASYGIKTDDKIHLVLRLRGGMFHEISGRDGNYTELDNLYFSLDNRDLSKHYIPDKPKYISVETSYYGQRNVSGYDGIGQVILDTSYTSIN